MPTMMSACHRARGVVLALLLVACAAGASGEEPVSVSGTWRWDPHSSDVIRLECQSTGQLTRDQHLEAAHIPPFNFTEMRLTQSDKNLTMLTAKLRLYSCPMPSHSLKEALTALQYPAIDIEELELSYASPDRPPRFDHFAYLSLKKLSITFDSDKRPKLYSDIFVYLPDLTELTIMRAILSTFPTASLLRKVELVDGQSTGTWGGCAELQELNLVNWEVPTGEDEGWLTRCPQLSTVRTLSMPAASLVRIVRDARTLTTLEIRGGEDLSPVQLESMFLGLQLKQLALPYEMFKLTSENTLPTSLEKLILYGANWSSDEEENQRVVRRLARLPALRDLELEDSSEADFCKLFPENDVASTLPALRRLSLSITATKKLCFNRWDSLEYLDLSYDHFDELELVNLPRARAHPLVVDLRGTAISRIPLDEAGYNLLKDRFNEGANVTIQGEFELSCDCEHGWVARALRTLPLSMPGARCKEFGGALLSDVPVEQIECDKSKCRQCTCRRSWRDNTTTETCETVPPAV